jgi:hypothetical protein
MAITHRNPGKFIAKRAPIKMKPGAFLFALSHTGYKIVNISQGVNLLAVYPLYFRSLLKISSAGVDVVVVVKVAGVHTKIPSSDN